MCKKKLVYKDLIILLIIAKKKKKDKKEREREKEKRNKQTNHLNVLSTRYWLNKLW